MAVWGNGTKTRPGISSPYGPRTGGYSSFHEGTDFIGYPLVYAGIGGKVTFVGNLSNASGLSVAIDIAERGPKGETITLVHMHLADTRVRVGQTITETTVVGKMGMTGNATGPCDHFEVRYWLNGTKRTVDPVPWLDARVRAGAPASGGGSGLWPMHDRYGAQYVMEFQTHLKALNLYSGDIDGQDGDLTQKAVKVIQGWLGFTGADIDGLWGPDTDKRFDMVVAGGKFVTRPTKDIQTFLKAQNVWNSPWPIDGEWGLQTSMATYRYQRKVGLTADAQWGAATDAKAFPVTEPKPPVEGPVGKNVTTRSNIDIQKKLAARGFYDGDIDGVYGAGTTAGVVLLQKEGDLEPDGIWGAETDVYGFKRAAVFRTAVQGVDVPWAGTKVTGRVITGVNVHHFGGTQDDRAYFAGANSRKSCPTLVLLTDGRLFEYIPPSLQPWSSGAADANRIAVEMQNVTRDPDWQISTAQVKTLIALFVEVYTRNEIGGVQVDVQLNRQSIEGHQELAGAATLCPGPYVMEHLDEWIAEAVRLTTPTEPEPELNYVVPKALGDSIKEAVSVAFSRAV
jgi:peptidoglycan hydrolase-like protein with peptidoglycan-binding domain